MTDKVLSLLGICRKAGKLASGEFQTEAAVKGGKAFLVVLSEDASANTKNKFHNMAKNYKVPVLEYSEKEKLGHSIGKELRSTAAVLDEGLAKDVLSAAKDGTVH